MRVDLNAPFDVHVERASGHLGATEALAGCPRVRRLNLGLGLTFSFSLSDVDRRARHPCGFQGGVLTSPLGTRAAQPSLTQTPFSRTKFPCIPIPLINLRPTRMPFES
jgi:hypothetical protein